MRELGFDLKPVADSHLCCRISKRRYSILQPDLSEQLLKNKVEALEATGAPSAIATANIGCQLHLSTGANTPVKHWIELVDKLPDENNFAGAHLIQDRHAHRQRLQIGTVVDQSMAVTHRLQPSYRVCQGAA